MKLTLTLALLTALAVPVFAQEKEPPKTVPADEELKKGEVPPDRPQFFKLYPPPNPGTYTPTRPQPSTATRRPDLFAPFPVYSDKRNWLIDNTLDIRYTNAHRGPRGLFLSAARTTLDYIIADKKTGREKGGARVQILAEPDDLGESAIRGLRASELYGFYVFEFAKTEANVKLGQFVLPFGLAAVYDTPLQPIQTLYGPSVGLRVDTGIMVDGSAGPYHYAASLTTGSGPNRRDQAGGVVQSFRLERNFLTQSGRIQVGGSLLSGKLPVTAYNTELPASGASSAKDFVDKTRFAADASYYLKKLTMRGELQFGADDQRQVWGYFGEGRYGFDEGKSAIAMIRRWNFGQKPQGVSIYGAGVNFELKNGLTIRTLYEYERAKPSATSSAVVDRRFTIQTRVRF
ncbi:MAG: hypothetical protein QM758_00645 [Armatimonas sp.]